MSDKPANETRVAYTQAQWQVGPHLIKATIYENGFRGVAVTSNGSPWDGYVYWTGDQIAEAAEVLRAVSEKVHDPNPGFSWEDVEILKNTVRREGVIADERPRNEFWQAACASNIAVYSNLADRIAALLPPRDNPKPVEGEA